MRIDGRDLAEIRPTTCASGVSERADGSAKWSQGSTSVLASVYGPLETNTGKEDPSKAVVDVIFKSRSPADEAPAHSHADSIRDGIQGCIMATQHPRMLIQVVLQSVGEDSGSLAACGINAGIAALIDAGIPMTDTVSAIAVTIQRDGNLLLDPTGIEEKEAAAIGSFAFRRSTKEPVLVSVQGRLADADALPVMIDSARLGCEKLSVFLRKSTEDGFRHLVRQQ